MPLKTTSLGRPGASYASPQFSHDGRSLAFTSDETGWRSLWVSEANGANAVRLETGEGEIGRPDWVPGAAAMRWSDDGKALFAVRRHRSRDTLLRISWPGTEVSVIESGWTGIEGLYARGDMLVFGSETSGLPPDLLAKYADHTLRLPMRPEVRSLNLSATAAAVMYEAVRQIQPGIA